MVNKVTTIVFPKYKTPRKEFMKDYDAYKKTVTIPQEELIEMVNFALTPLPELEQDIKSTGFYRNKAKSVQGAAQYLLAHHHGIIPQTMEEMIHIPGVGRKTANVVLGNAYHVYVGIAVDTHVKKQAQLLGLTKETTPEKIEQDLMQLFDAKNWFPLTYLLIEHGRTMRFKKDFACDVCQCQCKLIPAHT